MDAAFLAISHPLGELSLCHARLVDDARFPWILLVPRVADARELEDLSAADRARLMDEVLAAGRAARAVGEALGRPAAKLNIGQLGNVTPQLHLHVIARRPDDAAWPGPVWGVGGAEPYPTEALQAATAAARAALGV